jgi:MFS family permease
MIPRPGVGRLRASLNASFVEGAVAEVFAACAGGTILTGWALHLGASPLVIGMLGALPIAAQSIQLPAAWLTQRLGAKRLAVAAIGAARLVWLPIIALPFVPLSGNHALALLIAIAAAGAILNVVGNNAWTAWMGDLVPDAIRGRFFSRRMVYLSVSGTFTGLGAGYALDSLGPRGWHGETLAALAAVACIAGLVSVALLLRQHDPGRAPVPATPVWRAAVRPLRARSTRPFLAYLFAWNAAVGLSAAFFSLHMLVNLQMGFALAAVHGIAVCLVRVVAAPAWGRVVDRFGARPVLIVCSFGISLVPAIWLLPTPDRLWPIAFEALVSGALWSGQGIAGFDLSIGLAPRETRAYDLAVFATACGLGFAGASLVASLLAHSLAAPLEVLGSAWSYTHVLFLLSALARLGAAALAIRVVEPGSRSVPDLARALVAMVPRGWALSPQR